MSSRPRLDPPGWLDRSASLSEAYSLAAAAHGSERRATDRHYFLDHVVEVASMLHDAGFDEELVAVGLLHDAVERGSLDEDHLERRMGPAVAALVLALSEDPTIPTFDLRKAGLRAQVEAAGARAVTVYAADKLSDIRGLRRGIATRPDGLEQRMGTTVDGMASHYHDSVDMIATVLPTVVFLPRLRIELRRLASVQRWAGRYSAHSPSPRITS